MGTNNFACGKVNPNFAANLNHMKKVTFISALIFIIFLQLTVNGQFTQTIRGVVYESGTRVPLPGANVIVTGTDPLIGTVTDLDGKFRLEKINTGRVGIKVSFIGYNDIILNNLNLTSGKELVLEIDLEQKVITGKEVVITADQEKSKSINHMATVSSRGFTVEESSRYAGSRNDVARMASNFAGVRGTDDSRNDIIIRGNSPMGLLWRLEGTDIPNPNHWGATGTTGGPVSILNNNQLANSDFMTGAFPAEYGNAVSGVFDLKMRNGNNEKHEFTGQVGFNGFELGAEGPVSNNQNSSYLLNYRYSTLEVFDKLGVEFGTGAAIPKYQDISFKVNMPKTRLGSISIFGIGGKSDISFLESEQDTTEEKADFYSGEGFDLVNGSDLGVLGMSNVYMINNTAFTKLTIAGTYHNFKTIMDSLTADYKTILPYYRNNFTEKKLIANFFFNKKFSSRHLLKTGSIISHMSFILNDSIYRDDYDRFDVLRDYKGSTQLIQAFIQWQYRPNDKLTVNTGIHGQYFVLNESNAIEPRFGISYELSPLHSLNLGYGFHSQILPLTTYLQKTRLPDGSYVQLNKGLEMLRSQHIILGYDWSVNENIRFKSELYYQSLTKAAVNGNLNDSYSMLNQGANFFIPTPDTLISEGTGANYGIELTLEKFLEKGFYYLVTASLYDSKYKGSDDTTRNTAFAGNYVFNILAGKEFNLGTSGKKRKKQNILTSDIKANFAGGTRYTPINPIQTGENSYVAEYPDYLAYSEKFRDYFRVDFRIGFRQNFKNYSMEFALDAQNLLNSQNIFGQSFNSRTGETDYTYQLGLLVIPQFRIEF